MALQSETIEVSGIRCEGCVQRLGAALEPLEGLRSANANLLGQVTLSWDDDRLAREDIVRTLERAGFRPASLRE